MARHLLWAAVAWLIVAHSIAAGAQADPEEKKSPAVVELLEDGTDFLIENLDNNGGKDGSVAARNEQTFYSETCSLSVSSFQRFKTAMPGWNYPITENPEPGEFRYVRFAWKRTEAPGILLQFFVQPKTWKGYYAGTLSKKINKPMMRIAEEPPRKWELVTQDLFKDFGPIIITGINLSAMEGPGHAYFDHIYLGRTIEDLDSVTAPGKNTAPPPDVPEEPKRARWLFWIVLGIVLMSLLAFLALALILLIRRSKADQGIGKEMARKGAKPPSKSIET